MTKLVRYFLSLAPAILVIFILLTNAQIPRQIANPESTAAEIFIENGIVEDFVYLRNLSYLFYLGLASFFSLSFYMTQQLRDWRSYLQYISPILVGLIVVTFSFAISAFIFDLYFILTKRGVL